VECLTPLTWSLRISLANKVSVLNIPSCISVVATLLECCDSRVHIARAYSIEHMSIIALVSTLGVRTKGES
jgi:hypothetical protein